MKTKRVLALFTASMMTAALLAGCGGSSGSSQTTAPAAQSAEATEKAAEENIQSGNEKTETTVMEEAAESVTVAVDDDSFTIGPWGGASAVRDWTENILWAHLAYRPFIGAMLDDGVQLVAAKSVTKRMMRLMTLRSGIISQTARAIPSRQKTWCTAIINWQNLAT